MASRPLNFEFGIGRFRFRPTLGPTLFTIPSLIILLALGTWQVHRLEWKLALIAERSERIGGPAIAAPPADSDIKEIEYRHVKLTGHFLHDQEMYLAARSLNGNVGYHVVTPFAGDDGVVTLIDRGWIPLDRKDPKSRADGQVTGDIAVDGLIRGTKHPGWFVPDNRPDENFWFFVDVPAMAAHAGLANVRPYFIEAGPAPNPGGSPIGGQTRTDLPNDHLQYAITWYSFAIALMVIYLIYHRVKPD